MPIQSQAVAATAAATSSLLQDARSRLATRIESSRLCRYSGITSPVMYFPASKHRSGSRTPRLTHRHQQHSPLNGNVPGSSSVSANATTFRLLAREGYTLKSTKVW